MRNYVSLLLLLLLTACGSPSSFDTPNASGYYASEAQQCVPYARKISGINLYGNADEWWAKAEHIYARGVKPKEGAVLVLKKTPKLRFGHVAVVRDVQDDRQIQVTHSNWGNNSKNRKIIYESMLAEDASTANDWSQVRFWNKDHEVLGFVYPAYGFIYPR